MCLLCVAILLTKLGLFLDLARFSLVAFRLVSWVRARSGSGCGGRDRFPPAKLAALGLREPVAAKCDFRFFVVLRRLPVCQCVGTMWPVANTARLAFGMRLLLFRFSFKVVGLCRQHYI